MKIKRHSKKEMFANLIKQCHKPTARNSKFFKKNVRNVSHQDHCTNDICATLVAVVDIPVKQHRN